MSDLRFLHGRSGADGLVAETVPVAAHQRLRILDATTRVLYERGYADATVAHIVREARVSRRTFYEHFENKEHCYLAAVGGAMECMAAAIRERYVGDTWDERVAGAFGEVVRLLLEHPEAVHTYLVETGAAGAESDNRRADGRGLCRDGLAVMVERDFGGSPRVDPMAVELAVDGLHGVLRQRLCVKDAEGAAAAVPAALRHVLGTLVGAEAAESVVARLDRSAVRLDGDRSGTGEAI